MEKQRSFKTMALLALVLSVFGVSVAFAAMSVTLNITGTAKMDPAKWDVHFDPNSLVVVESDGAVDSIDPKIDNLTISDFQVVLTKPGDYVEYTFTVKNEGKINAKIGKITRDDTPTCTSSADDGNLDGDLVCSKISYVLTYEDGITKVEEGNKLAAESEIKMKLKLAYDISASEAPTAYVDITGLNITLTYDQDTD